MKRINSMVWGTVLLLTGLVLTLGQFKVIDVSSDLIVPIILLALAVVFHLYYFLTRGDNEGLLVPGGILLTYGLLFLWVARFNGSMSDLWPLFVLGPAVGLLELYAFSGGRKGSMIPVFILTAIGGSFLLYNLADVDFSVVLAIVLICLGVALMISALFRNGRRAGYVPPAGGFKEAPKVDPVAEVKAEPVQEEPKQE